MTLSSLRRALQRESEINSYRNGERSGCGETESEKVYEAMNENESLFNLFAR